MSMKDGYYGRRIIIKHQDRRTIIIEVNSERELKKAEAAMEKQAAAAV